MFISENLKNTLWRIGTTMKRNVATVALLFIIIMSFFLIKEGLFSFNSSKEVNPLDFETKDLTSELSYPFPTITNVPETSAVSYKKESYSLDFSPQVLHFITLKLNESITLKPILSFGRLFGFEALSEISSRNNSQIAINGGFFSMYGRPVGTTIIDGELICSSKSSYPSIIISNTHPSIDILSTQHFITSTNYTIGIDSVNLDLEDNLINSSIYTPIYGSKNRIEIPNNSIVVRNNIITDIIWDTYSTKIPSDGFVVSFKKHLPPNIAIGDPLAWSYTTNKGLVDQAYECGSYVVKDSSYVLENKDPWIGITTTKEPRTALGITSSNEIILLVADGRQANYSAGLSGIELGAILLEKQVVTAVMLDGGASSEMIYENKIVNRPSNNSKERPIAGGLGIIINNN
jgi:hypothetical protein